MVTTHHTPPECHYKDYSRASQEEVSRLVNRQQSLNNSTNTSNKPNEEQKKIDEHVSVILYPSAGEHRSSFSNKEEANKNKRMGRRNSGGDVHSPPSRGGVYEQFPVKLYQMLVASEVVGFQDIISWRSHGRSFKVHKPDVFVKNILPVHTRQSKLTSFSRQLNLYGFRRCTRGPDCGSYYHEMFLRNHPLLCRAILRTKVKGSLLNSRNVAELSAEPDFYRDYPEVPPLSSSSVVSHCELLMKNSLARSLVKNKRKKNKGGSDEQDRDLLLTGAILAHATPTTSAAVVVDDMRETKRARYIVDHRQQQQQSSTSEGRTATTPFISPALASLLVAPNQNVGQHQSAFFTMPPLVVPPQVRGGIHQHPVSPLITPSPIPTIFDARSLPPLPPPPLARNDGWKHSAVNSCCQQKQQGPLPPAPTLVATSTSSSCSPPQQEEDVVPTVVNSTNYEQSNDLGGECRTLVAETSTPCQVDCALDVKDPTIVSRASSTTDISSSSSTISFSHHDGEESEDDIDDYLLELFQELSDRNDEKEEHLKDYTAIISASKNEETLDDDNFRALLSILDDSK